MVLFEIHQKVQKVTFWMTCTFSLKRIYQCLRTKLFDKKNYSSKLFFKAIFSFSSTFNCLLFEICSVLQSSISSFCQRLWVHLWDKYCWLTFLVNFNNCRFDFFQHVPICSFGNKKRWGWCGRGTFVGSCDLMASFNIFDDFFLWEILHIFWDFLCQDHFCVIPCLLRLLFFNISES